AIPFLRKEGLIKEGDNPEEVLEKIMPLVQERAKTLGELPRWVDFFFKDRIEYEQSAVEEWLKDELHRKLLNLAKEVLAELEPFTKENIETALRGLAEREGVKAKEVFHPLRVAVTGKTVSPPLLESLAILGKEKTLQRIAESLKFSDIYERKEAGFAE
ncbi:MAG: hypothetical protein QXI68_03930, partial [Sulfolobales archaeon]